MPRVYWLAGRSCTNIAMPGQCSSNSYPCFTWGICNNGWLSLRLFIVTIRCTSFSKLLCICLEHSKITIMLWNTVTVSHSFVFLDTFLYLSGLITSSPNFWESFLSSGWFFNVITSIINSIKTISKNVQTNKVIFYSFCIF